MVMRCDVIDGCGEPTATNGGSEPSNPRNAGQSRVYAPDAQSDQHAGFCVIVCLDFQCLFCLLAGHESIAAVHANIAAKWDVWSRGHSFWWIWREQ